MEPLTLLVIGMTASGGLGLYALLAIVRRGSARRVFELGAAEEGTAVFEFPMALIVLVLLTLLTWQLGFMIVGYFAVDVAAYASARAAIVEYPAGRSASSEARDAAAVALVPVAGKAGGSGGSISRAVAAAPGGSAVQRVLGRSDMGRRLGYARRHTSVSVVGSGARGGRPVRARVRHRFSLRVPTAARLLGRRGGDGYVTDITAEATLMSERYREVEPSRRRPGGRARP
jgi:hypothetical protein